MSELIGRCPGCDQPTWSTPRYPQSYCDGCVTVAVDVNGDQVVLANTSLSGGFVAYVVGTEPPVESSATQTGRVFIHGRECRAREARFGGVAVQPVGTQGRGPRT